MEERFKPGGKAPEDTEKVGVGNPAVVYVKLTGAPTVAVVAGGPSVIVGG